MTQWQESMLVEGRVLVIGAAGLDVVGRLRAELEDGTSAPAHIRSSFGGVARNVAENLARLGVETALLSAVGDDDVGVQLLHHLDAAGVDTRFVQRIPGMATGSYLAVLNESGGLRFALDDMRVLQAITSEYIKKHADLFASADMLFLDTNLASGVLRTVFSLARQAKVPVLADPTATGLATRLLPYLNRLYCVAPNAREAAVLSGITFEESDIQGALHAARSLVSAGVKIAVITLGEHGVCYATSQGNGYLPAMRTAIVDPTGAGDALTAALIVALLNDIPLDDAMRLGVSAASLTLQYRGAVCPDISLEKLYDDLVV
ncbi:MAG: PfkB family carbohydrate kinase [Anaerolineales bacterium]